MTPDTLLAWMRRHEVPAPACGLCMGHSGHPPINDDGPPRCYPCLLKRGRWAADPDGMSEAALVALWGAHDDVIEIRRCAAHTIEWNWIGWPADPDVLVDVDGGLIAYGEALIVAKRAGM